MCWMRVEALRIPVSASVSGAPEPNAARAVASSPRATAAMYWRTTAVASFANSESLSSLGAGASSCGVADAGAAFVVARAGIAATAATGGRAGAFVTIGACVASAGVAGAAVTGAGVAGARVGAAEGADVARGVARDVFAGAGVAEGNSVGALVGFGEREVGSGDAGASVGAGVTGVSVAAVVARVVTTTFCGVGPRFPTSDSPAPMTKPRTTTAIRIGTSGTPPPGGGVDGGRERRGNGSDITRCVRAMARAYCEMNPKGTSRKTAP